MTREDLYKFIKTNHLEKSILKAFGNNYTRIKTTLLEAFVNEWKSNKCKCACDNAKETPKAQRTITFDEMEAPILKECWEKSKAAIEGFKAFLKDIHNGIGEDIKENSSKPKKSDPVAVDIAAMAAGFEEEIMSIRKTLIALMAVLKSKDLIAISDVDFVLREL